MTRRKKIRLASFALGLVLVLCGLWGSSARSLERNRLRLENSYRRALNNLAEQVSGMGQTLEKAAYAGGPVMQTQLSAQLLEQSGGAKAALAALPLSVEQEDTFARFLSQAGDYALYLSRRAAAGQAREQDDAETLLALSGWAGTFSEALQNAQARLDTEGASIGQVENLLQNVGKEAALPALGDDFDEAAKEFEKFPELLYDGPFSDHISRREPLSLQGAKRLTEEQAREKAAAFFSCPAESLSSLGQGGASLPVYSFTYEGQHVNITRQGGELAYFKRAGVFTEQKLSRQEAMAAAKKAISDRGLENMRESYFVTSDNMFTVNFASTLSLDGKEVICYPDLVKVTVELSEGGTVEYDATGYLMNHHQRELSPPGVTPEQAKEAVSPLFTVESAILAVIPTPGLDEVLCWELRCHGGEDGEKEFLVYVNCETGMEEQLFELVTDEHGTLVN